MTLSQQSSCLPLTGEESQCSADWETDEANEAFMDSSQSQCSQNSWDGPFRKPKAPPKRRFLVFKYAENNLVGMGLLWPVT